LSGPYWRPDQ